MAAITLDDITKTYPGGVTAVSGISFTIPDGNFTVLLGPSGCGKTTLLRMIAGLETITSGTCTIGGRIANDLEPAERDIAMVFQNYALYPHMTVYANMAYGLKNRGTPAPEIARRVADAAKLLEIEPYLDRKPRALSGGQRQRVAMGRAIVREPQAFLFDEPLSNLDAKLRVTMRLEIRKLHNRLKATSVFVTHDQVEAMTLADQVVVMNKGRVEQIGRPIDVYRRPATTFVASFIGAPPMNLLDGRVAAPGRVQIGSATLDFDAADYDVAADRAVTVGIRPEDLRYSSGSGLPFEPDIAEELGASRLVHGKTEAQTLLIALPAGDEAGSLAAAPPSANLAPVSPAAVHLFDPASGKSLRKSP